MNTHFKKHNIAKHIDIKNRLYDFGRFILGMCIWGFFIWCIVQLHIYFSSDNIQIHNN